MFDEKTRVVIAAYAMHENTDKYGNSNYEYEFLYWRGRFMSPTNWREKLMSELAFAASIAGHVVVVAYEKCDDARTFEDGSYAVIAYEQEPHRAMREWVGDEIAEEIQLW